MTAAVTAFGAKEDRCGKTAGHGVHLVLGSTAPVALTRSLRQTAYLLFHVVCRPRRAVACSAFAEGSSWRFLRASGGRQIRKVTLTV